MRHLSVASLIYFLKHYFEFCTFNFYHGFTGTSKQLCIHLWWSQTKLVIDVWWWTGTYKFRKAGDCILISFRVPSIREIFLESQGILLMFRVRERQGILLWLRWTKFQPLYKCIFFQTRCLPGFSCLAALSIFRKDGLESQGKAAWKSQGISLELPVGNSVSCIKTSFCKL